MKKQRLTAIGYERHILKDNATGEVFGNAVWFDCPICGEPNLAQFHESDNLNSELKVRCCREYIFVTPHDSLNIN